MMMSMVKGRTVEGKGLLCRHAAAVMVLAALWAVSAVPSYAGAPTDAMKTTIDEVLRIVRDHELKQPNKATERRQLLERVVDARFDYQEMSRRALGVPWNTLSDQERQEFVSLFRTLLAKTYENKIETYAGEGVQYLNERIERVREGDVEKEYAEVRTKLLLDKVALPLDYRLENKSGDWRVYDVIAEGVSLVNNYRKQFKKIIESSSYTDLVEQLRKKSEKLKIPQP